MTRSRSIQAALLTILFAAAPLPTLAQDSPEQIILRARQAVDLTTEALRDVVDPIGGLLGRISPSSSYATANRGVGYGAISLGATGLQFEITDPDYTNVDRLGNPGKIDGPAGAVFADAEIGLFSGYGRTSKLKNVASVDLLLRLGATLGDQDDLAEQIDLDSFAPIYGAGLRIGLIRGDDLPSVSFSAGSNHFAERRFSVQGEVEGDPFSVDFDFKQTSSFFLFEVGKQWRGVLPYTGGGVVWHHLESEYKADVVFDGGETTVQQGVTINGNHGVFFGGVELGVGLFRLVLETGSSSGALYGTFFIKLIPFPGYAR